MVTTRRARARSNASSGSASTSVRSVAPANPLPAQAAAANAPANAPQVAPAALLAVDPAVAAHLAAVAPALAAIAAAIGLSGAVDRRQGPQSQAEPEDEPNHEAEENPGGSHAKKPERVDLRNIKVASFDGTVLPGSFDAKAREFREEMDDQIQDAQALAGQTWSDEVKKAAMKTFVTGMARR
ncbi:hypothetical protein PF005_g13262 [Phytophthora fragariae]|uniref:Uncharacterized protein n=2 Tax=Phytophthora fragariae TaxID=53985 RepID=A0A6A3RPB8_9STRA|nr:hypothetical protein PF003_g40354 [Phytophthora fragariae]KAE8940985.1 hypothetical protein PF009_g9212 [Phytophthora fragariae]KAE8980798.1 hypothetical protein PF011_g22285 [Phytophthora fragariae]KAE9101164.1 hypothetical protein PF006_g22735 [Phytophthora fragariae]KAE9106160.1 hypothetical protein PF007_g13509 [Phytophthora fragariae]